MKRKHTLILLVCALFLVFTVAGCGSKDSSSASQQSAPAAVAQTPVSAPAKTAAPAAAPAPAPVAAAAPAATPAPASAKASGKVVVYSPSPAGLADKIAAGFTAKTGIAVEQFQGTTGKILARLEAEAANPVADVVILASWPDGQALKDKARSYVPENADKMYPTWIDAENKMYGYSASAVAVLYNTLQVENLTADWKDLTNPLYHDLIAIPDPNASGSAKDFITGFINAYGEDAWRTIGGWVSNDIVVPGANAAALEAVTTGEKAILVAGVDYNAYSAIAKGEPLGIHYPASGTVINPRPAMILETSRNSRNAELFMDYLLSDEAQKLVANAYLLPGRQDVTTDKRTNVADIPQVDSHWDWMEAHSAEIMERFNALVLEK